MTVVPQQFCRYCGTKLNWKLEIDNLDPLTYEMVIYYCTNLNCVKSHEKVFTLRRRIPTEEK